AADRSRYLEGQLRYKVVQESGITVSGIWEAYEFAPKSLCKRHRGAAAQFRMIAVDLNPFKNKVGIRGQAEPANVLLEGFFGCLKFWLRVYGPDAPELPDLSPQRINLCGYSATTQHQPGYVRSRPVGEFVKPFYDVLVFCQGHRV